MVKQLAPILLWPLCLAPALAAQNSAAPEQTGAIALSADPLICAQPTELLVWLVTVTPSGSVGRTGSRHAGNGDCRWTIPDLKSGNYEAQLKVASGSGGSQQFVVRPQAVTDVVLSPPSVAVSGRVLLNDVGRQDLRRSRIGLPRPRARFWTSRDLKTAGPAAGLSDSTLFNGLAVRFTPCRVGEADVRARSRADGR